MRDLEKHGVQAALVRVVRAQLALGRAADEDVTVTIAGDPLRKIGCCGANTFRPQRLSLQIEGADMDIFGGKADRAGGVDHRWLARPYVLTGDIYGAAVHRQRDRQREKRRLTSLMSLSHNRSISTGRLSSRHASPKNSAMALRTPSGASR